jgi:hypothetical protein
MSGSESFPEPLDYADLLETLQLRQATNRQAFKQRQELNAVRQQVMRQKPLES